jgi:hypothetical protein
MPINLYYLAAEAFRTCSPATAQGSFSTSEQHLTEISWPVNHILPWKSPYNYGRQIFQPHARKEKPMLNPSQHQKIARKCTHVLAKVIDDFPSLLAQSDAEVAAEIVAGIIKTQLTMPAPQIDPADALSEIIKRASEMED